MRADRLLSILMLLQSRGRMTSQALAADLEVSERTIYRDIEALSCSGIPIYAEHGPGGGFALLDSYRTNLTGMTEDELRALLMVSVPAPLEQLGVSHELRSALLKLSAAVPASHRSDEDQVRNRLYLDWDWWFHADEPVPFLKIVQQAVWEDRQLLLSYHVFYGSNVEDFAVDPYGLVAKAGVWFLVAMREGRARVFRLADIFNVKSPGGTFSRLPGFNLETFWKEWCGSYEREQHSYWVTLRISRELFNYFPLYFGYDLRERMVATGEPDEDGWRTVILPFRNLETARGRILTCGGAAEVLEPLALRLSLADLAAQIQKRYA